MASEDHTTSFQNVSECGVGELGIGEGRCNHPSQKHRSSGWLLLQAKVVIAFPEVSSDLARASVFRTPPAWAKTPPTPCVIRSHSPCLLATLPCICSLGPAFSTLAARLVSCFILGPALCSGLSWPALAPLPRGDGTWGGRVRCCGSFAASASCAAQTGLHLDPTPRSQNDGCCCLVAEVVWGC